MWWLIKFNLIISALTILTCASAKGLSRLLVDQLRLDFLELENSLWNLPVNELLLMENPDYYLAKKMYEYDQQLIKVSVFVTHHVTARLKGMTLT